MHTWSAKSTPINGTMLLNAPAKIEANGNNDPYRIIATTPAPNSANFGSIRRG